MAAATTLAPNQLRALARLRSVPNLAGFYLAGGTAVAVHLGHRVSRDLDLFSVAHEVDLSLLQDALVRALSDIEVVAMTDATLHIKLEGVPIDLVRYRYATLEPLAVGPDGFPTAAPLDLAVMKLAAIAHRGLQRDFWDMHALLTRGGLSLDEILAAYLRRFGKTESDLYHVLRALTYFDDAERESPMPIGLTVDHWHTIRQYFENESPAAFRRANIEPTS